MGVVEEIYVEEEEALLNVPETYEVGDSIEYNTVEDGWQDGEIVTCSSGSYTIKTAEGSIIENWPPNALRLNEFLVGDDIEYNTVEDGWLPGKMVSDDNDGTFTIETNDGSIVTDWPINSLRLSEDQRNKAIANETKRRQEKRRILM